MTRPEPFPRSHATETSAARPFLLLRSKLRLCYENGIARHHPQSAAQLSVACNVDPHRDSSYDSNRVSGKRKSPCGSPHLFTRPDITGPFFRLYNQKSDTNYVVEAHRYEARRQVSSPSNHSHTQIDQQFNRLSSTRFANRSGSRRSLRHNIDEHCVTRHALAPIPRKFIKN